MHSFDVWAYLDEKAAALGVKPEARRKWRERGKVPYRWRLPLVEAARGDGKEIDPAIFDEVPMGPPEASCAAQ